MTSTINVEKQPGNSAKGCITMRLEGKRVRQIVTTVIFCFLFVTLFSKALISERSFNLYINQNEDTFTDETNKISKESFSEVFTARQSRIEHICYKLWTHDLDYSSGLHKNMKKIYVLTEAKVAWCPVFKAGSTTIIKSLHEIWNQTEVSKRRKKWLKSDLSPLDTLSLIAPQLSSSQFRLFQAEAETLTFVVVRHPFHKIVSAFRDKLERIHTDEVTEVNKDYYYKKFGAKIVANHRISALKTFGSEFFDEKHFFGSPMPPKGPRTAQLPTFWEFVQYLKNTKLIDMDEHWAPTSTYCLFCAIDYDYVIKYENFSEEIPYLWNKLGHNQKVSQQRWNSPDHSYQDNVKITELYFSMLSDEDILELYKIYKNDFDMFYYNFNFRNITIHPENQ